MSIVARRYAQALMNLAVQAKDVEGTAQALDELADSMAAAPPLQSFLAEPKVAPATKEAVVQELLAKAGLPPLVNTFVRFITRKRRIGLLEEIRTAFHDLVDERMGRASAWVTAAAELSVAQQEALRARLQALTGKQIRLRVQVDPGILGGVVARVGSTVWDASLRNQLNRMQDSIVNG